MENNIFRYSLFILITVWAVACGDMEEKSNKLKEQYTGPQAEIDSMFTVYSDSGKILFTIRASRQVDHFNGDRDFPGPLFIEFYDGEEEQEKLASTLSANEGKYIKEDNLYTVSGNVIVTNIEEKETLRTEELNWLPGSDSIYTHRAVVIRTPTEVLHGEGLSSNQSFTNYRILKPIGEFEVDE